MGSASLLAAECQDLLQRAPESFASPEEVRVHVERLRELHRGLRALRPVVWAAVQEHRAVALSLERESRRRRRRDGTPDSCIVCGGRVVEAARFPQRAHVEDRRIRDVLVDGRWRRGLRCSDHLGVQVVEAVS